MFLDLFHLILTNALLLSISGERQIGARGGQGYDGSASDLYATHPLGGNFEGDTYDVPPRTAPTWPRSPPIRKTLSLELPADGGNSVVADLRNEFRSGYRLPGAGTKGGSF